MAAARAAVLIPAFEAARSLAAVIAGVRAAVPGLEILVVDDGSTDGGGEVARAAGARVVTHARNLGKGEALKTGFRELLPRARAVVTLDADGQHDPAEIPALLGALERSGAAMCVGTRMGDTARMPWLRRLANRGGSAVLSWLAGADLQDTQSGFRVYRSADLPDWLGGTSGYDYESEVLIRACRSGKMIVFESVSTRYGDEKSHFRPVRDGIRFLRLVLRNLPGAASGPFHGAGRSRPGRPIPGA